MMLVSQLISTKKQLCSPLTFCWKEYLGEQILQTMYKFGHINVRSLYPKLDEINAVVVKHDFDVVCVSETWLGEQFKDNDVEIPDYNIYRKDRVDALGGGVCIYIKNHLTIEIKKYLMLDEIEAIWLELKVASYPAFIDRHLHLRLITVE